MSPHLIDPINGRPLTRGRGLKLPRRRGSPIVLSRPLTRGRGLKRFALMTFLTAKSRPLTWGRGLKHTRHIERGGG